MICNQIDEEGAGRAKATFSPAEEEKFHEMARDPELYDKLSSSIAPSIYGDYTTNIKKAIACLLVGGSRKRLPDGMIVRQRRPLSAAWLHPLSPHSLAFFCMS